MDYENSDGVSDAFSIDSFGNIFTDSIQRTKPTQKIDNKVIKISSWLIDRIKICHLNFYETTFRNNKQVRSEEIARLISNGLKVKTTGSPSWRYKKTRRPSYFECMTSVVPQEPKFNYPQSLMVQSQIDCNLIKALRENYYTSYDEKDFSGNTNFINPDQNLNYKQLQYIQSVLFDEKYDPIVTTIENTSLTKGVLHSKVNLFEIVWDSVWLDVNYGFSKIKNELKKFTVDHIEKDEENFRYFKGNFCRSTIAGGVNLSNFVNIGVYIKSPSIIRIQLTFKSDSKSVTKKLGLHFDNGGILEVAENIINSFSFELNKIFNGINLVNKESKKPSDRLIQSTITTLTSKNAAKEFMRQIKETGSIRVTDRSLQNHANQL